MHHGAAQHSVGEGGCRAARHTRDGQRACRQQRATRRASDALTAAAGDRATHTTHTHTHKNNTQHTHTHNTHTHTESETHTYYTRAAAPGAVAVMSYSPCANA
jgi:hypothetical protein